MSDATPSLFPDVPFDSEDFVGQVNFAIGALVAAKDEVTNGLTANGEWIAKCLSISMTRSARALALLEASGRGN